METKGSRSDKPEDSRVRQRQEQDNPSNEQSSSSQGGELQQDSRGCKQKNGDNEDDENRINNAVSLLQQRYRGYRNRREALGLNLQIPQAVSSKQKGRTSNESSKQTGEEDHHHSSHDKDAEESKNSPLSPNTRWNDALSSGGLQRMNSEQMQNKNDARSRWQRTGFYAERITGTDGRQMKGVQEEGEGASSQAKAKALAPNKQMEAQYWLELVDSKHRYGTNLKSYHDAWNKSDTKHNFFYWLDNGSGKDLDLPDCPREQLDRERVTYLSAEQRKNYLVDVGKDGLLYWHRNGRKVDTAKGKWEDLGNGRGIGYKGEKDHLPPPKDEDVQNSSSSSSSSASSMYSSSDSEAEANHQPDQYKQKHYTQKPDNGESKTHYLTSPKVVMDLLLRKTINSNTWIYVSDTSGRLFIGIKSTGGFQHSSFMYGATVASAGLLKAQNGRLTSLSPLSGHYRAGTKHFKAFHKSLQERGVDMSKVSVSKSLMVIRAIEKYGAFSKKKKSLKTKFRHKLHLGPNEEEKKQAKDEERNEKIEEEAQRDHQEPSASGKENRRGPVDRQKAGEGMADENEGNSDSDDEGHDEVQPDMHDDMKKEDMSDKERAERAIALIRSAFSKGLKNEEKGILKDAESIKDDKGNDGTLQTENEQATQDKQDKTV